MSATMHDLATTTDPAWTKPGAGVWELDKSHFSPNASRLARDIMEYAVGRGIREGFDEMGSPLKTVECRFLNGHMYMSQVNLVAGDKDLPTPPAPILWLASRLHPVYRSRTKQAAKALDERFWRSELERWQREWKPQLTETSLRLSKVATGALNDDELADHVAEAVAHITHGATLHFRLHISDLGPIGRLLVRGP